MRFLFYVLFIMLYYVLYLQHKIKDIVRIMEKSPILFCFYMEIFYFCNVLNSLGYEIFGISQVNH